MKRILITGARSYVGKSFDRYIRTYFSEQYVTETLDMRSDWTSLSFAGFDCVVHVAGIAHSDGGRISAKKRARYRQVNTELAIAAAKKAKADGAGQFIFMSSAIVYGNSAPIGKEKMITAQTAPAPANFYGQSKLDAERGILPLSDGDFRVAVLRCPMIFGPSCRGNYPILSRIACHAPLFVRVENQRSMLYIDNLCELVRLVIENGESGILHPQDGAYYNTSELVREIARIHGRRMPMLGGCLPLLRLLSHLTGKVNKAFGNLTYDPALSEYKQNYRVVSVKDAIAKAEKADGQK